jgi:hypothetical protein
MIVIVRAEDVVKTPKAFQQYVADWFAPKTILGLDCLWASCLIHLEGSQYERRGRRPAVAPSHSVDTACYSEGLRKGTDLNEWMRRKNGKLLWIFYAEEERHDRCIDED